MTLDFRILLLFRRRRHDRSGAFKALKAYTELCLIMAHFNQAIRILLPFGKLLIVFPSVFATYAIIKLEGIVSLFCGVYAFDNMILLELMLSMLAEQNIRSQKLIDRLKPMAMSRRSSLWKKLLATKPIAMTVGRGTYFVDKTLVLTVLHIVAINTVNVLIAYE